MPKQEFKLTDDMEDAEERRERELQEHARRHERKSKDERRRDVEDYNSQTSRPERAR